MKYLILIALLCTVSCTTLDRKTLNARPTVGTKECFDNYGTVRDPDSGVFYYVTINNKYTCVDVEGNPIKSNNNSNDVFTTGKDCPAVVYRSKLHQIASSNYISSPRAKGEDRTTSSKIIWEDKNDCYFTCQGYTKVVLYKDDVRWCSDRKIPEFGLPYSYKIDFPEVKFSLLDSDEIRGDIVKEDD